MVRYQVTVVRGPCGSGKSSRVPQLVSQARAPSALNSMLMKTRGFADQIFVLIVEYIALGFTNLFSQCGPHLALRVSQRRGMLPAPERAG